jgi:hypothetical protein
MSSVWGYIVFSRVTFSVTRLEAVVKRMGESFAVYGCGASCLLAPCCSDIRASQHLAPHRITSSPALIAGDTPDAFVLIRGLWWLSPNHQKHWYAGASPRVSKRWNPQWPLAYKRGNAPASWGLVSYNLEQIEIASTDNVAFTGGYMSRKFIFFGI